MANSGTIPFDGESISWVADGTGVKLCIKLPQDFIDAITFDGTVLILDDGLVVVLDDNSTVTLA